MYAKDCMKKPYILAILDGWGYRTESEYNAIAQANPQTMHMLMNEYPWTTLQAAGTAVGTLPGYTGNSEVGHMTIGTGTIIEQPLTGLSIAIESGALFEWEFIQTYCKQLQDNNKKLHIIGLLSDGGVHSHEQHAHALISCAAQYGIDTPIIHPFLDGRDVPPKSAHTYLERLEHVLQQYGNGYIGSIMGRYYAMDRDQNWQRTLRAYSCLTGSPESYDYINPKTETWRKALSYFYGLEITDEFIPPVRIAHNSHIEDGDGIIFFNFRADRARQLTALLLDQTDIAPFTQNAHGTGEEYQLIPAHTYTHRTPGWMITGSQYYPSFQTKALYKRPRPETTLCDILADHDKRIFRIAETQKYAHVTYFFNGGDEQTYPTETRTLIPSLKVSTYQNYPEMSAQKITDAVKASLEDDPHDFYLINYANPDMVGHTGDMEATQKAITCVDDQVRQLYELAQQHDVYLCITADHGNAEDMYYPDRNMPRTSHTDNPVPCIFISPDKEEMPDLYGLADIAPWLLHHMHLPIPDGMRNSYGTNHQYNNDTSQSDQSS